MNDGNTINFSAFLAAVVLFKSPKLKFFGFEAVCCLRLYKYK